MPLTDEQKSALQTLKEADPADFATELKETAQPLYQKLYNAGHSDATKSSKQKQADLEKQLADEQAAKQAAEEQAAELREKQPDIAKLNEQWQAKLAAQKKKDDERYEQEKTARQTEREARKKSDLKAALTGLDPAYIEIAAERHADRIRYGEDGKVQLLEENSEVPVQLGDGKTPFVALADEIKGKADPRWHLSNADRGSGTEGGSGAGGSTLYERIRAEQKAKQEQEAERRRSIAERVGT